MKRILVRLVVSALAALAAMGVSAPAVAGKSSLIVVGPGMVVHFDGHRGPVKHRIGHHRAKPGFERRHAARHGAVRHGKLHHGKAHRFERRDHHKRDTTLHSRPLARHYSKGRHRAKVRPRHRTRQFFLGHGVQSPHHGPRFSSGHRKRR